MTSPPARLHGIPNCDTVKKARAWLTARGVAHEFIDFKKAAPAEALLRQWLAAVGEERLLNRKGSTWRALDDAARAAAEQEAGAIALMRAQPSLIKRPVVQWPDGALTVGFDPADWAARTAG
jgi:arsenate reductase